MSISVLHMYSGGRNTGQLLLSGEHLFGTVKYVTCYRPTELITSDLITNEQTKTAHSHTTQSAPRS